MKPLTTTLNNDDTLVSVDATSRLSIGGGGGDLVESVVGNNVSTTDDGGGEQIQEDHKMES